MLITRGKSACVDFGLGLSEGEGETGLVEDGGGGGGLEICEGFYFRVGADGSGG